MSDYDLVQAAHERQELERLVRKDLEARIAKRERIAKIVDCHAWVEQRYKDWMANILMEVLP
jgi:hypothetical protein